MSTGALVFGFWVPLDAPITLKAFPHNRMQRKHKDWSSDVPSIVNEIYPVWEVLEGVIVDRPFARALFLFIGFLFARTKATTACC